MVDIKNRIPEDFIQALLARLDIVEVVGAVVPLRKAGSNYVACCPFHNEKTPSFSVNRNKQFYHCFGCGVSGDAIQFIIEHNSVSFVEAIELLAAQAGMQMPVLEKDVQSAEHKLIYNVLSEAAAFFEQQLRQQTVAKQAVQYLKDRGVTGITAKHFGLGFAPPGWDNLLTSIAQDAQQKELGVKAGLFVKKDANKYYDRFRNRIIFPIRNRRGKVIGFGARTIGAVNDEPKYINSPETPVFSKSYELYGYYEARQAIQKLQSVVVVEGYMDVVSLAQAGVTNVVATLGTACTEQHIQTLLKVVPEIIFCFDGDTAGKKAAWRSLELCLPLLEDKYRIKFLILRGNEDPDSYVRKHGLEALQLEIKQAISLPDLLFDSLAKKHDLEQIDGRVQFANQIKQYVSKLPDGMLKTMLFDRLARTIDIDPAMFRSKKSHQSRHHEYTDVIATKHKSLSPATRALALLITDRTLLADLPEIQGLERVDIAGSALLCAVVKLLLAMPNATDAEIKDKLPLEMSKYFDLPMLRGIAHNVPTGVKEEFLGAIGILRRREKELAMDELLRKAKQNALSAEEKLLLQQMLQEK
ncbi:MAG TPA: DNA primase [Gammaproteobacteria bacterium]|nr:DNA primase [Gammaproteobacteria bacterium]